MNKALSGSDRRALNRIMAQRKNETISNIVAVPDERRPKLLAIIVRSMFYRGLPEGWGK